MAAGYFHFLHKATTLVGLSQHKRLGIVQMLLVYGYRKKPSKAAMFYVYRAGDIQCKKGSILFPGVRNSTYLLVLFCYGLTNGG